MVAITSNNSEPHRFLFSSQIAGVDTDKEKARVFCLKIFPIPSGTRLTCLKFHSNFHRNYSGKAPFFAVQLRVKKLCGKPQFESLPKIHEK